MAPDKATVVQEHASFSDLLNFKADKPHYGVRCNSSSVASLVLNRA